MNFFTQTATVYINGVQVGGTLPFLTNTTVFGGFLFDTFGGGAPAVNDKGYLDNLLIQSVSCPDNYASWWFWYVEPPCRA
jgi:hypothetical protein